MRSDEILADSGPIFPNCKSRFARPWLTPTRRSCDLSAECRDDWAVPVSATAPSSLHRSPILATRRTLCSLSSRQRSRPLCMSSRWWRRTKCAVFVSFTTVASAVVKNCARKLPRCDGTVRWSRRWSVEALPSVDSRRAAKRDGCRHRQLSTRVVCVAWLRPRHKCSRRRASALGRWR